jgi:hypothetical protein
MKRFVRMTLHCSLRFGLSLAVVLWITGQLFRFDWAVESQFGLAVYTNSHLGLSLGAEGSRKPFKIRWFVREPMLVPADAGFEHGPVYLNVHETTPIRYIFRPISVGIRHWLVVAMFVVFNVVLQAIYRQRSPTTE